MREPGRTRAAPLRSARLPSHGLSQQQQPNTPGRVQVFYCGVYTDESLARSSRTASAKSFSGSIPVPVLISSRSSGTVLFGWCPSTISRRLNSAPPVGRPGPLSPRCGPRVSSCVRWCATRHRLRLCRCARPDGRPPHDGGGRDGLPLEGSRHANPARAAACSRVNWPSSGRRSSKASAVPIMA